MPKNPPLVQTPACLAVQENGLRMPGRGGRLALVSRPCDELDDQYVTEVRVTVNYLRNDGLEPWPLEAGERAARRFELVLGEVVDGRGPTLTKDQAARAVFKSPPTLWVQENDRATEAPGGRIVLVADTGSDALREELEDLGLQAVTVLVNYRRNAPMDAWPLEAADREARRYQAVLLDAAPAGADAEADAAEEAAAA